MGTVRYTSSTPPPTAAGLSSSVKKGGKRKAMNNSRARSAAVRALNPHAVDPDDLSVAHALAQDMLDQKLASRDKWQISTQRNFTHIRTEYMAVRRELGRLEELVDTVQMQVEDGLAGYERRREELVQFMTSQREQMVVLSGNVTTAEKQVLAHKDTAQHQMLKMNKTLEQFLESQPNLEMLVDEETLMAQLAGLQERYDNELSTTKSEVDKLVEEKVRLAVSDVNSKVAQLQDILQRKNQDEREHDQRAQSISLQVRDDVVNLQRRIAELEDRGDRLSSENMHLRTDLDDSRKLSVMMEDRLSRMDCELERQARVLRNLPHPQHHHQYSPPLPPHPPPPQMLPPPPPVDLYPLEQKIHCVARDVQLMADDYTHWKNRADANMVQLRQEMAARMSDLQGALFKALSDDSDKHRFENTRLKDVCFDLRSDLGDVRKEMMRVHDQMTREIRTAVNQVHAQAARARARSRSPPPRRVHRYESAPQPSLSIARDLDVEGIYFRGSYRDSQSREMRRGSGGRSRSRSRSRNRSQSDGQDRARDRSRSPHGRRDSPVLTTSSEMLYLPLNRPDEQAGDNTRHRENATHEVIVIEEDGDDEQENVGDEDQQQETRGNQQQQQHEQEPIHPPNMAPPEVVMDEDPEPADDRMENDMGVDAAVVSASALSLSQCTATVDDLRIGALLYVCFGGAPTLGSEWLPHFSSLRASDSIAEDEMEEFKTRHEILLPHPPPFAQFVVRATKARLETMAAVAGGGGGNIGGPSAALTKMDASAVPLAFAQAMRTIRRTWNDRAFELLAEELLKVNSDGSHGKLSLSKPPPPMAEALREWARQQTRALSCLLRRQTEQSQPHGSFSMDRIQSLVDASPGTLVFLCLFDVTDLDRSQVATARFRLNNFGRQLLRTLWEQLLNTLPAVLFMECAWLDDQSRPPVKMPLLAIAQVLSTVLLWFSPHTHEADPATFHEIVAQSVAMLRHLLVVDGKTLAQIQVGSNEDDGGKQVVMVRMDASHTIEIQLSDFAWPMVMELDSLWDLVPDLAPPAP